MKKVGVNACTDVTGFGFLGHLHLMLTASSVSAKVYANEVPVWTKAMKFAEMGFVPAGVVGNRAFLKDKVSFEGVDEVFQDILFDPQTSGGLLISVPNERCEKLVKRLKEMGVSAYSVVGEVLSGRGEIRVV